MKVESEEVESEVKLGRVGLSERDGSVVEDVDPACGSWSTSAFLLAIGCVRIVQFQVRLIWRGQEMENDCTA